MSFAGSFFSKLGLGESRMPSYLPQYSSPSQRPSDDHDLADLSPRPHDALLADDSSVSGRATEGSLSINIHQNNIRQNNTRKAKGRASVTIREPSWPPTRNGDATYDYTGERNAHQKRQDNHGLPPVWRASLPPQSSEHRHTNTAPQTSILESVFLAKPTHNSHTPPANIDKTFKEIGRRENNLQKELQRLLDAQDFALERHLADDDADNVSSRRSSASEHVAPKDHIVPVRQPKKRPLSKREARIGISHCLSQLSDLKNEEDAYVATAFAERKSALSRLRNLASKRNNIVTEITAIESDRGQSLKSEIQQMEDQHRSMCQDIEQLELKLRDLKHRRSKLEIKIAEAKSKRDSELSGYTGALKECDIRISDLMTFPGVSALDTGNLLAQDADLKALAGEHMSGFEFLALRPERRTLPMAKDWWEGELQLLELRRGVIDTERLALEEGVLLWQDVYTRLEAFDQQLKLALSAASSHFSQSAQRPQSEVYEAQETLKKLYNSCKSTINYLEGLHKYTQERGWQPLVLALIAEMNYFEHLKQRLGETLSAIGWADGIVTPPRAQNGSAEDLLAADNDINSNSNAKDKGKAIEDELTGSVIRRWDDNADSPTGAGVPPATADADADAQQPEESDNEVPAGLLSEAQHHGEGDSEDEDEQVNDVPPEFLSMHSPRLLRKDKEKGKGNEMDIPPLIDDGELDQEQRDLSRQSTGSANEVPADLLAESHT